MSSPPLLPQRAQALQKPDFRQPDFQPLIQMSFAAHWKSGLHVTTRSEARCQGSARHARAEAPNDPAVSKLPSTDLTTVPACQLRKPALVSMLRKTTDGVRCAQKAQGHEWSVLQSVHSSVARQPPFQSQVTAFGAVWSNFSLQLAISKPYLLLQPSANWQARPFRLHLQSACQSSQSSRAARNMSTAVASRALRKSRQPRLTELKQPLVHTSEEQVDKSWPAFGGVCRSRNTQKCGTTLFLHCKIDFGVDAALLDGDVAKPPAAAPRQYSPKRPCSSSLTPRAADPSSEAGFQVARLCRSATAVVLPHRGCTMLHTLHVPHASKAECTRAYTEAFPCSDVCLSTSSTFKNSCNELLRKPALVSMLRKTTDGVWCAQKAQGHEWSVLQSVHSSVARQPPLQSQVTAFGAVWSTFSLQLANSKPYLLLQPSANWKARPFRLLLQSACHSSQSSRAARNMSTAVASRALRKSRQPRLTELKQPLVHISEEQVDQSWPAFGWVCRSRNTQKCGCKTDFGVDAALLDGDVAKPPAAASRQYSPKRPCSSSLTPSAADPSSEAGFQVARLCRSATAVVLPHRGCTMLHTLHVPHTSKAKSTRAYTEAFPCSDVCLSTSSSLKMSCNELLRLAALAVMPRKTTDRVRCAQKAQGHEWCVLQSVHSSVARQPLFQFRMNAFGSSSLAKCLADLSFQLASSKPCLLLQPSASGQARSFRLSGPSACQSPLASSEVRNTSTAGATAGALWKSRQRCSVGLEQTSVPQPIAHGQKLAARAGFRPRRVALLHRDAAKQLAGSLTAGHRRRGVVAALSYARLASVHARSPRQLRQERVLTRQLLKFSRQPKALSTFPGLALRKFMSDTAHAGVERKTTDCVRCAQQAQGHEWCVLQSVHASVARQPPLQSQVTTFGAVWSNFSLQLANLLLQPSANWQARPFRLHLQSACQSSQSSRAARNMSTAGARRALWKSRQPCLMRLEQTRAHALQQVEENLLAFVGVCRSCNKQKCGTTLFLQCKTNCGVDAALLDGDVAKPPAAASRQYCPKRPCSSSLTPSAADPSSEAGFQVARLFRSATAVFLPHRGCTMLHTLHVPHASKAAQAVSPCNAVEVSRAASSSQHKVSIVAAFCQSIVTLVCQQFCQAARLFCQAAREQTIWNARAEEHSVLPSCCMLSLVDSVLATTPHSKVHR
ncbi:unnamed protein product, partial [Polarella glacialis]